jgi:hypothetical protein
VDESGRVAVDDLRNDTGIGENGAVRSVQSGTVWLPSHTLTELWTPTNLERLARTYWQRFGKLSWNTLHVVYGPDSRSVALFGLIPLLTFYAPDYELGERRGSVTWRIKRGLLVARRGTEDNGYLQIAVEHLDSDRPGLDRLHVELTVANFYPAISDRISRHLYSATQSRIHVLVTYSFLRSLARGDLAPSKVGRFEQWPTEFRERVGRNSGE